MYVYRKRMGDRHTKQIEISKQLRIDSILHKLYERLITRLFQNCINGRDIPEEWEKKDCNNYRGIKNIKIYGKVFKENIEHTNSKT